MSKLKKYLKKYLKSIAGGEKGYEKLAKSIAKECKEYGLMSDADLNSVAGGGGPEMGYSTGSNGIYGDSAVPNGFIPYNQEDWFEAMGRSGKAIIPRGEGAIGSLVYPCNGKWYSHKIKRVGGREYINPVPTPRGW